MEKRAVRYERTVDARTVDGAHAATERSEFIEIELDGAELRVRRPDGVERTRYQGAARARWERDKQVASALANGYRSVAETPLRLLRDDQLEQSIRQSPDDPAGYLVYADWLQAHGEPRGELICVQHALAEQPRLGPRASAEQRRVGETLRRAEIVLLMTHRERFFGPSLCQVFDVDTQTYRVDLFELRWQLGFIRRAAIRRNLHATIDQRRAERAHGDAVVDRIALWRALTASSSALVLREIELHIGELPQLLPLPDGVTDLELLMLDPDEYEDIYYGARQLREDDASAAAHAAALDSLLRQPRSALRRLTLQLQRYRQRLLDVIADSPGLRQLEQLDLSNGALDDDDAAWLVAHGEAFAHLERLDLRRNRFGVRSLDALRRLGPFVVVGR